MKKQVEIGFIGGGNMAEALIKGLLGSKKISAGHCRIFDVLPDRLEYLRTTYGVQIEPTAGPVVEQSGSLSWPSNPSRCPGPGGPGTVTGPGEVAGFDCRRIRCTGSPVISPPA